MGENFGKGKSIFFISLVSLLILTSGVFAFFLFSFDSSVDYQIVGSKKDLNITLGLSDQVFNVSESLVNINNFKLVNQNGATEMNYTLNINATNLDPINCNSTGDISFELNHSNQGIINSGSSFNMFAGLNDFNFTATAVNNRVCPQNITADLSFSEL